MYCYQQETARPKDQNFRLRDSAFLAAYKTRIVTSTKIHWTIGLRSLKLTISHKIGM